MPSFNSALCAALLCLPIVSCHISMWHPSMWGFNATETTPFYGNGVPGEHDNRPVVPLMNRTFDQWWFHGYHDYPPNPDDIMQLPAGGSQNVELACNKVYTSYWAEVASEQPPQDNDPCPGLQQNATHTHGIDDLGGCALAIAYESDATQVKPEDFTVFSVNQTCVWTKDTEFQVPADMPACPNGKCTCAWFWIHQADGGSEQNYMIAFQCNITNATGTTPVAKGNPARRCGDDPQLGREANPANCTVGARTPTYWFQYEQNNFFEDAQTPPVYTDLYGWTDGAQNDIFRSVAFGTDPNPPNNVTSTSTTSAAPTATATLTSTQSTSSPTSISIPPLLPGVADTQICLRPRPQETGAQSKIARLANALGLGQLSRRREMHGPRLRRRVSSP